MAEVTTRDTQLAVDALADALKQDASSGIRTIAQALAAAREEGRREERAEALEAIREFRTAALNKLEKVRQALGLEADLAAAGYVPQSELAEARAEVERLREKLWRIREWTDRYGAELKPTAGSADTFGDGVRACKARVKNILAMHDRPSPDKPSDPRLAEALANPPGPRHAVLSGAGSTQTGVCPNCGYAPVIALPPPELPDRTGKSLPDPLDLIEAYRSLAKAATVARGFLLYAPTDMRDAAGETLAKLDAALATVAQV